MEGPGNLHIAISISVSLLPPDSPHIHDPSLILTVQCLPPDLFVTGGTTLYVVRIPARQGSREHLSKQCTTFLGRLMVIIFYHQSAHLLIIKSVKP